MNSGETRAKRVTPECLSESQWMQSQEDSRHYSKTNMQAGSESLSGPGEVQSNRKFDWCYNLVPLFAVEAGAVPCEGTGDNKGW